MVYDVVDSKRYVMLGEHQLGRVANTHLGVMVQHFGERLASISEDMN